MANTLNLGTDGNWAVKKDSLLAYNSENNNFKPLPFDFSRASGATRVNKEGLIETVGSGEPRIDYKDDTKGALLLEPQRSNLYSYSEPTTNEGAAAGVSYESFDWGIRFLNCVKFGDNSTTRYRYGGSVVSATQYTVSAFVIMDDLSEPVVSGLSNTGDFSFVISGSLATTINSNIHYGNNIYKVSATTISGTNLGNNGIIKYTSQSSKGFRVVGWQLEQGSYATSYIPTSGSAVTRVQDTCSQTVPDGVIGQTEGSIYSEFKSLDDVANLILWMRNPSGGNYGDMIKLECGGDNRLRFEVKASNVTSCSFIGDVLPTNIYYKVAVAYKQNDFVVYINGVQIGVDTSGNVPTCSEMYIGKYVDGGVRMGVVKDLKLYNTRLSNSELQALTQ